MKMSSATFLLLGKLPTPSDYAARAKSSFTTDFCLPKLTKVTLFSALPFASIRLFALTELTSGQLHSSTNPSVDPISGPS